MREAIARFRELSRDAVPWYKAARVGVHLRRIQFGPARRVRVTPQCWLACYARGPVIR